MIIETVSACNVFCGQLYYTTYWGHVCVCQLVLQGSDEALLIELVNLLLDVIEKVHNFDFPSIFLYSLCLWPNRNAVSLCSVAYIQKYTMQHVACN